MYDSEQQCTELTVLDIVPFGQTASQGQFYALRLETPRWPGWSPGQFVMLRPRGWGLDMLWARPFSICHVSGSGLVVFFQTVGRGTRRLTELKAGDAVMVWGPLGNSFAVEPETPTLLLAGGIGIAPFVGYVHAHPKAWNVCMDFGHRMPVGCYPFENIGEKIVAESFHERSPEDRQRFVACMEARIQENAEQGGLVLACGPTPFLQTVQTYALKYRARCQLSLETRMACGVGGCLGCVTSTTENHRLHERQAGKAQVCNNGPVFWADQVDLSKP